MYYADPENNPGQLLEFDEPYIVQYCRCGERRAVLLAAVAQDVAAEFEKAGGGES